jgi:hypothetical protein
VLSCQLTNHVCLRLTLHFFLAYTFQPRPRRGGTTAVCNPLAPFINPTPGADHIEDYLTEGETEEEWVDEAQLAEVSARFASRAEVNEVCRCLFIISTDNLCHRSRLTMILLLLE